jgi:hypothetical protein
MFATHGAVEARLGDMPFVIAGLHIERSLAIGRRRMSMSEGTDGGVGLAPHHRRGEACNGLGGLLRRPRLASPARGSSASSQRRDRHSPSPALLHRQAVGPGKTPLRPQDDSTLQEHVQDREECRGSNIQDHDPVVDRQDRKGVLGQELQELRQPRRRRYDANQGPNVAIHLDTEALAIIAFRDPTLHFRVFRHPQDIVTTPVE